VAAGLGGSVAARRVGPAGVRVAEGFAARAGHVARKKYRRAPVKVACPVGTNAGLYVSLVGEGRYDEAFQVTAESNPFPAICGRVCTAPFESVCRRGEFDEPIAIRDLKRFAMDHGMPKKRKIIPPKQRFIERVAIVGAGPTGLSAAYYLARRGYRVTVFDAMPVAGGMMAIGIPEYRLPREELNRDIEAMIDLGVEILLNTAIGRAIGFLHPERDFDAGLLAVGAQPSPLPARIGSADASPETLLAAIVALLAQLLGLVA